MQIIVLLCTLSHTFARDFKMSITPSVNSIDKNPLVTQLNLTPCIEGIRHPQTPALPTLSTYHAWYEPPAFAGSEASRRSAKQKDHWKPVVEAHRNSCFLSGNVETKFHITHSLSRNTSNEKSSLSLCFRSPAEKRDICLG